MSEAHLNAFRDIGRKIMAQNGSEPNDQVSLGVGMLATPFLREAVKRAAAMEEAAMRAKLVFERRGVTLQSLSVHPRKGALDWGTGKPLQGRRYRQACRAWNRVQKR